MRPVRTIIVLSLAAVAVALAAAPIASADSFTKIFKDYARTGRVDGCKYSAKELAEAQRQVPNDIEQYAPDFPAALQAAAEQRASGACRKSGSVGTAAPPVVAPTTPQPPPPAAPGRPAPTPQAPAPPPPSPTPQPTPDPKLAPGAADNAIVTAAARDDDGARWPAPLLLLAIFSGLLALVGLAWGAARWWAWDPAWLGRTRHASAEAGLRAGAVWSEFSDWVRFGR
jgi:hypothetical protein